MSGIADEIASFRPMLVRFGYRLTHSREEAEDLAQSAIAAAIKSAGQFKPGTNLKAWLHTILRYELISERRRYRNRMETEWADICDDVPADVAGAADHVEYVDAMRRFLYGLAALPPNMADSLVAVTVAGLTHERAAREFGSALGTVKSQVFRARQELKRIVDGGSPRRRPDFGRVLQHAPPVLADTYANLYEGFRVS